MTKAEIVKTIHARTRVNSHNCAIIVDEFLATIKANMVEGHNIYLRGFGTFAIRHHNEKRAYNINNATHTTIPSHCTPYFKAGKELTSKVK